jgi:hypothetical protein
MGNKIQKVDYSERVLNEMIPMELKKNNQRNKFNSIRNTYKNKNKSFYPCKLNQILQSNSAVDFSHALSKIILKKSNERILNSNLYLSCFVTNDDNYFEDIDIDTDVSNNIQINFFDDMITTNKKFKKIYEPELIETENDGIVMINDKANDKFSSNNMVDISLQEYLKIETERLKNDPIYQQKAREYSEKELFINIAETPSFNTETPNINKADFTKNKHMIKEIKRKANSNFINHRNSSLKPKTKNNNTLIKQNTKTSYNKTLNSTNRTLPSIRIDIRDLFKDSIDQSELLRDVSIQKLNIKPNKK